MQGWWTRAPGRSGHCRLSADRQAGGGRPVAFPVNRNTASGLHTGKATGDDWKEKKRLRIPGACSDTRPVDCSHSVGRLVPAKRGAWEVGLNGPYGPADTMPDAAPIREPVRRTSFKGATQGGKGAAYDPRCQGGKTLRFAAMITHGHRLCETWMGKKNPAGDAG